MIQFPCRCSQMLEVPDDQAGLTIQCPKCGLLADVPTVSDLTAIDRDGTYKIDPAEARKADDLHKLTRVYFPGHQLTTGEEIDLRGPVSEQIGVPPEADSPRAVPRPRYDPETGELVQALEIQKDDDPQHLGQIPMAAPLLNYGTTTQPLEGSPAGIEVLLAMFSPPNMMVMGAIFVMHLLLLGAIAGTVVIPFFIIAIPLIVFALVGHYAMVLEEMGPAERDELPRPLRNVHPYDDLFTPFGHMVSSLVLCYAPVLGMYIMNFIALARGLPMPSPNIALVGLIWYIAGSVLFPAIFLTICTSGTFLNLRPDRVLRTMYTIGWMYVPLVVAWMVAGHLCIIGQLGVSLTLVQAILPTKTWLARPYVAYPILMLGIYLMHAFCWYLGRQYRLKSLEFPWINQRHIRAITPVKVVAPQPPPAPVRRPGEVR